MKIEDFSNSLSSKDLQIQDLSEKFSRSQKQLEESLSESQTISSGYSSSKQRINDLESEIHSNNLTIETLHHSIQELELKLESSLNESKSLFIKNEESQDQIKNLSYSLKSSEKTRSDLISRIDELESSLSRCFSDIKSLEAEKNSLVESSKLKPSEGENDDFDFSIAEQKETMNFLVCKAVKYESRTYCLIYVKNQHPEYLWYEKYFLQELNPEAEFPVPYEEQLEAQIESLKIRLEILDKVETFPFPEDLKNLEIFHILNELVKSYNQRKSVLKPIKIGSFEPEVSSPAISNFTSEHDLRSESEVQITAQEAEEVFSKMSRLMRENEELENDKLLLTQQLNFFKGEQRTGMFDKNTGKIEEIRPIILSILEKLPLQAPEIEKNINIVLEMMGILKEAKASLMEKRNLKSTPEKSSFKKLFSKKKN
jgi:predicted  nucleic acid-binding Zn-ribbon protein